MISKPVVYRTIACIPSDDDPNIIEIRNFGGLEASSWMENNLSEYGIVLPNNKSQMFDAAMEAMKLVAQEMGDTGVELLDHIDHQKYLKDNCGYSITYFYISHQYNVQEVIRFIEAYGTDSQFGVQCG
jgi:hypothetical protein